MVGPSSTDMRAIYVVSGEGNDFFSAMTRLSVAALRLTNPLVQVGLACDAVSHEAMRGVGDPLLEEVDGVVVGETPPGDTVFRNRFVKTTLRGLIDGPFLFLDSDILIRGPIDAIFETKADVAGAPNRSNDAVEKQIWSRDQDELARMGWVARPDVYVNGGVLFFQESEPARRFAQEWHKRWQQSYERGFSHRDQPALNSALAAVGPRLDILPHRFNAQFRTNADTIPGAVIWHYYASAGAMPTTTFEMMVRGLLRGEPLDSARVEEMIRSSHPWRRDRLLRIDQARNLAARVYRRLKNLSRRQAQV